MDIDRALWTLQELLDKRQRSIVAEIRTAFPDRMIEQFSVRHTTGVSCLGVRAEWDDGERRLVQLHIDLAEIQGEQSARGFVYWDQTYLGSDGKLHTCHDGATQFIEEFTDANLIALVREMESLEQFFVDAVYRGEPLIPSPIEQIE